MSISTASEIPLSPILTAYAKTNNALGDSAYRLTSGLRYIHTGDDTASVSAATSIKTNINSVTTGLANTSKATSFLQIAENGVAQIQAILDGLVTLTTQANTAGTTDIQRFTLDAQFQSALQQIDSIVSATTFGGAALFDGSFAGSGAPAIITGNESADVVTLSLPDLTSATLFAATPSLDNATNASAAITPVTDASDTVNEAVALVAAYQAQLVYADQALHARVYGSSNAADSLLKVDTATESRARDLLAQRQDLSAALIAQTLRFSTGLLDLLGTTKH